ncbi:alpha-terpineol synthase, chloroplastic-like [Ananas comosus]|uniref:Alpha-terpineol synthase, chloroplastic-like n=1 Tax=Ananas comosus TaxID=4615 RepID=A0A6P5FVG6_ANACO|nr:alpha-terpineol synthase, chloroplastic-like [Ananas comosus]
MALHLASPSPAPSIVLASPDRRLRQGLPTVLSPIDGLSFPQCRVADIFDRFKDEKGNFKSNLSDQIKSLLSLYEASYLAAEGEDTLIEAQNFTIQHLNDFLLYSSHENEKLHTRWFINAYEKEEKMRPVLLAFAKLDFNVVQNLYKGELKDVSRLAQTKANSLIAAVNNVYDVYGSPDELELLTKAVDRWNALDINQLPEYMKVCFLALFNTTSDIAYETMKEKGLNILPFL